MLTSSSIESAASDFAAPDETTSVDIEIAVHFLALRLQRAFSGNAALGVVVLRIASGDELD